MYKAAFSAPKMSAVALIFFIVVIKKKMKEYGITSVPTTIVDGNIKVVSIPDFPWICGDDLYRKLKRDYPLKK